MISGLNFAAIPGQKILFVRFNKLTDCLCGDSMPNWMNDVLWSGEWVCPAGRIDALPPRP
jgi:hypothetical protein